MNRTTKADREKWIAAAAARLEHNDPAHPWRVTNRAAILASLQETFGISAQSAHMALFHASMRYNTLLKRGNQ